MSCSHSEGENCHNSRGDQKNVKSIELSKLFSAFQPKSSSNPTSLASPKRSPTEVFSHLSPINDTLAANKPWKKDVNYFKKVYISALALTKMTIHAKSGGSIEIMGMMTGKIIEKAIIVMDVYPLPVEGTETRVNAQAEGYEFMVRYLEANKKLGRNENIVGWYHSHPGYGCWLSGIDVGTQSLNQNFQDPYLAVVIDPIKTAKQNKVEIGAFRTYPKEHLDKKASNATNQKDKGYSKKDVPKSKMKDFGIHSDQYYSLDIEIFNNPVDSKIMALMSESDETNSITWLRSLITNYEEDVVGVNTTSDESRKSGDFRKSLMDSYEVQGDENMEKTLKLVELLQSWERRGVNLTNIDATFEDVIYKRLLQGPGKTTRRDKPARRVRLPSSDEGDEEEGDEEDAIGDLDESDAKINENRLDSARYDIGMNVGGAGNETDKTEDDDESNLDEPEGKVSRGLDVSDFDDAVSMESSSVYKNDEDASVGSVAEEAEGDEELDGRASSEQTGILDCEHPSHSSGDLDMSDEDSRPHPLSMKRSRVDQQSRRGPRYSESNLLLSRRLTRREKLSKEVATAIVNSESTPLHSQSHHVPGYPTEHFPEGSRAAKKFGGARPDGLSHFSGIRPQHPQASFAAGHDVEKLTKIVSSIGESEFQQLLTLELQEKIFL